MTSINLEQSPEDRLRDIEARERAATKGPWWVARDDYDPVANHQPYLIKYRYDDVPTWIAESSNREQAKADFDFIAAARDDVPWLLALVREQAARLAALEGSHKKLVWGAREATVDLVHLDETDAVTPDNVMTICAELSKAIAAAELPGPAAAEASERSE